MHAGVDLVLVDKIVNEVKSQGVFDQFRKDSMADVDTKPAYQNLRQRVESTVSKFLAEQKWKSDLNKFQLREKLRKHIVDAGFLDTGVERIVDQVVNPKISTVFEPKIEDIAYKFLGIEKPHRPPISTCLNGSLDIKTDLLPTDLEAVSPDSDKTKSESKEDVFNDSIEDKNDEYESPPFEPIENDVAIDTKAELVKTEESHSNQSQLSGISGLTSDESVTSDPKDGTSPPPKYPANTTDTQPESELSEVSSNSRLSIVTNEENNSEASKPLMNKPADVDISEEAQMPKFSENSDEQNAQHDLHFDIKREDIKFEGTERKGEKHMFSFSHLCENDIKVETGVSEMSEVKSEEKASTASQEDHVVKLEKHSPESEDSTKRSSIVYDEKNELVAVNMSVSGNESSQETNTSSSDSRDKKQKSYDQGSYDSRQGVFRPRPPSPPNDYMFQKPPSPNYYTMPIPPPPNTPPPPPPPPSDDLSMKPPPPPIEAQLPPKPPSPELPIIPGGHERKQSSPPYMCPSEQSPVFDRKEYIDTSPHPRELSRESRTPSSPVRSCDGSPGQSDSDRVRNSLSSISSSPSPVSEKSEKRAVNGSGHKRLSPPLDINSRTASPKSPSTVEKLSPRRHSSPLNPVSPSLSPKQRSPVSRYPPPSPQRDDNLSKVNFASSNRRSPKLRSPSPSKCSSLSQPPSSPAKDSSLSEYIQNTSPPKSNFANKMGNRTTSFEENSYDYINSPSPPPYEELRPDSPTNIDVKAVSPKELGTSQKESNFKPPSPSKKESSSPQEMTHLKTAELLEPKSSSDRNLKPPSTPPYSSSKSSSKHENRSSSHSSSRHHHHKSSKSSKSDRDAGKSHSHHRSSSSSSSSRTHTASSSHHRSGDDKRHSSSSSSSSRHKSSKSDSRDRERDRDKDKSKRKDDHSAARHKDRRRKSTDSNDGAGSQNGSRQITSRGHEKSQSSGTKESTSNSNSLGHSSSNSNNSCNDSTKMTSNSKHLRRGSPRLESNNDLKYFVLTEEEIQKTKEMIDALTAQIEIKQHQSVYLLNCENDIHEIFADSCKVVNIDATDKEETPQKINLPKYITSPTSFDLYLASLRRTEASNIDPENRDTGDLRLSLQSDIRRKRTATNRNSPVSGPLLSDGCSESLIIDYVQYDKPAKKIKNDLVGRVDVSPTSSDLSVSSKENDCNVNDKQKRAGGKKDKIVNATVRIEKSNNAGLKMSNQRYTSEDLYKPRPFIQRPRRRELMADEDPI